MGISSSWLVGLAEVLCYVGGGSCGNESGFLDGVVSLLLVRRSWILGQNGMVEKRSFRCERSVPVGWQNGERQTTNSGDSKTKQANKVSTTRQ